MDAKCLAGISVWFNVLMRNLSVTMSSSYLERDQLLELDAWYLESHIFMFNKECDQCQNVSVPYSESQKVESLFLCESEAGC